MDIQSMTGKEIVTQINPDHTFGALFVNNRYLKARKNAEKGIIRGYVAGHGGDLWWVDHNGEIAVYFTDELKDEPFDGHFEQELEKAREYCHPYFEKWERVHKEMRILNLIKEQFEQYPDTNPHRGHYWMERCANAEDILGEIGEIISDR